MTIPNLPIVVVMSAEQTNNSMNESRTAAMRTELARTNLQFEQAMGSYRGIQEQSFVVVLDNPSQLEFILDLASEYQQESILIRSADGSVELAYANGQTVRLPGSLQQVSKERAEQLDAWTYLKGAYYAVV